MNSSELKNIVINLQEKLSRIESELAERKQSQDMIVMDEKMAAKYAGWSASGFKANRLAGNGPMHFFMTDKRVLRYLKADLDQWITEARDKAISKHEAEKSAREMLTALENMGA